MTVPLSDTERSRLGSHDAHAPAHVPVSRVVRRPRLGFLGVGWIGRQRLEAIVGSGAAEVVAIADPDASCREQASASAPDAALASSLDDLLALHPDAIVIATPSALHAEQAVRALRAGAAVFCQKPLGRTAAETYAVVTAARAANRLLSVDLSYRYTQAARAVRTIVREGELGSIYAADLTFHNAYGPDKPWFMDARLSGGGCLIDLGTHLIDLALWTLDWPWLRSVSGRLYARGQPFVPGSPDVEDHAIAQIDLANGAVLRVACSWNLHAGRDALIEATFHGTDAGAAIRNVDGSFYDFVAERYCGTGRQTLTSPPDAWGGRAAVAFVHRLAEDPGYHPAIEKAVTVTTVLDGIYGR